MRVVGVGMTLFGRPRDEVWRITLAALARCKADPAALRLTPGQRAATSATQGPRSEPF